MRFFRPSAFSLQATSFSVIILATINRQGKGTEMVDRVLVVDDQASIRDLLCTFLRSRGVETSVAEDGETALQMLDAPLGYSLILLDLDFGPRKMHGLDVLREICERHAEQAVIILTGQATITMAVQAMQLGARDFVEKDLYIEDNLARALDFLEVTEMERAKQRAQQEEERTRLARIERELEDAQDIQKSILPSSDPSFQRLDISSAFYPATEIGGDYYDYLRLSDTRLGIAVGDAQGHGLPAGLLVSTASGCLHTVLESSHSAGPILEAMNRRFFGFKERTFMTFCFATIDTEVMNLTLATAGHHFPYHFSAESGELVPWDVEGSFPLGVEAVGRFPVLTHSLATGDVLLFYSDSLVEAMDAKQEHFGHDRLEETLVRHVHLPAKSIRDAVLDAFWTYHQQPTLTDDTTLVVVKITA